MDQPKVSTPNIYVSGQQGAPEGLPVLENKKIITHTMKEDIAKIGGVSGAPMETEEQPIKPFSEKIPPPPMPPTSLSKDAFHEPIEETFMERDQPVSLPGSEDQEPAPKQFKIFIPPPKKIFNSVTIILIAILVLLIAGGGFGYWWFFIKPAGAPAETTQEPAPTVPPAPEPQPIIPIPQPEPLPPPVIIPPVATSTQPIATSTPPVIATSTPPVVVPPVATSTPPIAEPALPEAIINADQTIVLELPGLASTTADVIKQIREKNAKIAAYKAIIRYPIKLSLAKEKRFANNRETAQLMNLAMPADFWGNTNGLELIGYKNGNVFRYGLAAKTSNKEILKQIAEKWQATMLDDLKPLYIEKPYVKPAAITFSENSYLDFYKRYLNMPSPDVSLDYAISDKYFIVATSKEMIYAALDKTKTPPQIAK